MITELWKPLENNAHSLLLPWGRFLGALVCSEWVSLRKWENVEFSILKIWHIFKNLTGTSTWKESKIESIQIFNLLTNFNSWKFQRYRQSQLSKNIARSAYSKNVLKFLKIWHIFKNLTLKNLSWQKFWHKSILLKT